MGSDNSKDEKKEEKKEETTPAEGEAAEGGEVNCGSVMPDSGERYDWSDSFLHSRHIWHNSQPIRLKGTKL